MFWVVIGYVVIVLTAIQFVPQVFKAFKTRKLRDISLITFILVLITASFWIIYGTHNSDTVIVIANSLIWVCAIILIVLKIKHHEKIPRKRAKTRS